MFDEAQKRLERAKEVYIHALVQVDRLLKVDVANDDSLLDDAKAFQKAYSDGIPRMDLKASEQPGQSAAKPAAKAAK